MKLFNKKLKPILIDQNIINEYMKQKYPEPIKIVHLPAKESDLNKLLKKIMYNIILFIYNYFLIISILIIVGSYLYYRYIWYQKNKNINDAKKKESTEIKKYFDDIFSGKNVVDVNLDESKEKKFKNIGNYMTINQNDNLIKPGKKIDISVANNNGYMNHLKQTLNNNFILKNNTPNYTEPKINNVEIKTNNTEQNIIKQPQKTVRFANQDFDAFGRNNINPKTGEIIAFNDKFDNYSIF